MHPHSERAQHQSLHPRRHAPSEGGIGVHRDYYNYELNRWNNEMQWPELFGIYDLVCTCKKFEFIKSYSFLIHYDMGGEYDDVFCSVNYLGVKNGPSYWKINKKWSGYVDDIYEMRPKMPASNYGYYVIDCVKYDFDDLNFDMFFDEIYQNFHDDEIINFTKKQNGKKIMMIRKSFPTIKISDELLEQLLCKYKIPK